MEWHTVSIYVWNGTQYQNIKGISISLINPTPNIGILPGSKCLEHQTNFYNEYKGLESIAKYIKFIFLTPKSISFRKIYCLIFLMAKIRMSDDHRWEVEILFSIYIKIYETES